MAAANVEIFEKDVFVLGARTCLLPNERDEAATLISPSPSSNLSLQVWLASAACQRPPDLVVNCALLDGSQAFG